MASYFALELDTTPPLVEIYAPMYTVVGIDNEIEVVANEELSPYQEIYIIDNLGVRHNLIFHHEGDRFLGIVNFDGYPQGSAYIYAIVRDTLLNESHVSYGSIDIISGIDAMRMTIVTDDITREITINNSVADVEVLNEAMGIEVSSNYEYMITVSASYIAT